MSASIPGLPAIPGLGAAFRRLRRPSHAPRSSEPPTPEARAAAAPAAAARVSGAWPRKLRVLGLLNPSGRAGPRRPAFIMLGVMAGVTGIFVIATSGRQQPAMSQDARLKPIDPLPGGLHSTPEQDALALEANAEQAKAALRRGTSYSPPMAPSQPAVPPPLMVPDVVAAPAPPPPAQPKFGGRPTPQRPVLPAPLREAVMPAALVQPVPTPTPTPTPTPRSAVIHVAAVDPKAEQDYANRINAMFSRWGGDVPRTDVILAPESGASRAGDPPAVDAPRAAGSGSQATGAMRNVVSQPSAPALATGRLLIPAGRGVYAHPILALSSDQSSPVVLQADTGPIAGDRMIGSFARQNDRLVIHINTVVHNGQEIGVDGLVTSPDTMEAGVASDVDQHYISRFLLPAAAAFVAGLGQAIEQTSNTTAVLSPLGGATTLTHLNLNQQLAVGAGAAAAQVGATLNQAAPKGPTISLEANVAVGVMFLANVTEQGMR